MRENKSILFVVPYPLKSAPSQRFRFEQYLHLLESNGFQYSVHSFITAEKWQIFFQKGHTIQKAAIIVAGFVKRLIAAFRVISHDFVFIHREATPVGPPFFEWFISRILRKRIIYDFDDAIWNTDRGDESVLLRISKWRSKVSLICKWSYKISCGNEYLQRYALQYNKNAVVNPTTIDLDFQHNAAKREPAHTSDRLIIGWTGSHSTLKYLKQLESVLSIILQENPNVAVCIIADRKPDLSFTFQFIPWRLATEIEDLMTFNIGIMPLPDDEWSKGKCGFKILQYMALKIPALASPVGVNSQIIADGVNGFLCNTESEWLLKLTSLIKDNKLREMIGASGYEQVRKNYSVASNARNFLRLFT